MTSARGKTVRIHFLLIFLWSSFGALGTGWAANPVATSTLEPSVVRVINISSSGEISTGSGFVVSDDGHIVTNHHVVEDWQKLGVIASETDQLLPASEIWSDPRVDLAVLHVPSLSRIKLSFTPSKLPKGADVVAMGFPGIGDLPADTKQTVFVTKGAIARYGDMRLDSGGPLVETIVHSAEVSPGNSGGPLFDLCGRVVGINTAVRAEETAARVNLSSRSTILIQQLRKLNVNFSEDSSECTPAAASVGAASGVDIEKAKEDAESAREDARAARELADRLQAEAASGAADANARAENLERRAMDIERQTELLRGKIARENLFRNLYQVALTLGLFATILFLIFGRGRKIVQVVESQTRKLVGGIADAMTKRSKSYLLIGMSSNGRPIKFHIQPDWLKREDGVVIGRHARFVDLVIESPNVSRRQFRLLLDKYEGLTVEDLLASNTTHLNGFALSPYEKRPIKVGDAVEFAGTLLSLSDRSA